MPTAPDNRIRFLLTFARTDLQARRGRPVRWDDWRHQLMAFCLPSVHRMDRGAIFGVVSDAPVVVTRFAPLLSARDAQHGAPLTNAEIVDLQRQVTRLLDDFMVGAPTPIPDDDEAAPPVEAASSVERVSLSATVLPFMKSKTSAGVETLVPAHWPVLVVSAPAFADVFLSVAALVLTRDATAPIMPCAREGCRERVPKVGKRRFCSTKCSMRALMAARRAATVTTKKRTKKTTPKPTKKTTTQRTPHPRRRI